MEEIKTLVETVVMAIGIITGAFICIGVILLFVYLLTLVV